VGRGRGVVRFGVEELPELDHTPGMDALGFAERNLPLHFAGLHVHHQPANPRSIQPHRDPQETA